MIALMVDGNNVLSDPSFTFLAAPAASPEKSRASARGSLKRGRDLVVGEEFLQKLELVAVSRDWEVIVVFDGPDRFLPRETGPLVVRYAQRGQTADTAIERLVYQAPDRTQVVVVTQDRAEADLILGLGARVWTVRQLLEEMESPQR